MAVRLDGSAIGAWVGMSCLFILGLLYACHFNLGLCYRFLTFGEGLVIASAVSIVSDAAYITTEHFSSLFIFGLIVASVCITVGFHVYILVIKRFSPALWSKTYIFFPGFYFISDHVFFIAEDYRGVISVSNQSILKPKTLLQLEQYPEEKLKQCLDDEGVAMTSIQGKPKEQLTHDLFAIYASDHYNPFNLHPKGRDTILKMMQHLCVVAFLLCLQALNIALYAVWPLVMLLRLPALLGVLFFLAQTKLIFLRRPWNMFVYLWTLDEALQRPEGDKEVDMGLLHSLKLFEIGFQVGVKSVLQLVNTSLNGGQPSFVYYVSLAATVLDALCSVRRYSYHFVYKGSSFGQLKDSCHEEIGCVESKSIELRHAVLRDAGDQFEATSPHVLAVMGGTKIIKIGNAKIVPVGGLSIS